MAIVCWSKCQNDDTPVIYYTEHVTVEKSMGHGKGDDHNSYLLSVNTPEDRQDGGIPAQVVKVA